ncbi:hypothetical protein KIN20_006912 [Parelaphostrongylus tenuis]|uniref:Uncharacterized protein n=1 Tax=Parelaphostrongylus tenuis TaxID=148309 RepID=A0AAD5QIQ5_PARTN|nr:hypothetical protein KIN20_006912 [Parelaphostrongylus tenuis]
MRLGVEGKNKIVCENVQILAEFDTSEQRVRFGGVACFIRVSAPTKNDDDIARAEWLKRLKKEFSNLACDLPKMVVAGSVACDVRSTLDPLSFITFPNTPAINKKRPSRATFATARDALNSIV